MALIFYAHDTCSRYGKTLKEAQAKADEFKRALADGVDMAAREQTVSQWVETWLSTYGCKGTPATICARAAHARRLVSAIGDKTTQALLGHADPSTTMRIYTHLSAERRSASVDALSSYTSSRYGHQMGITPSQKH